MASPAYEQILQVQALDLDLMRLRHRHATHPRREELARAEAAVGEIEARRASLEERRHALDRDQKRLSDEVEMIESKRSDVDGKLYGGEVTSSKDLLALQDEAASLLDHQRRVEDQELGIMEQLEVLDEELTAVRVDLGSAIDAREEAERALAEATSELDEEIGRLEADRAGAASGAVPDLLARYDELSPLFDGIAVARLVDGRCDGCHIQLSAVAVDRLSRAPDDAVVTCEECGRLLVR